MSEMIGIAVVSAMAVARPSSTVPFNSSMETLPRFHPKSTWRLERW
jgi:hypothetical protein